jgi:hypothetical protein
VKRVVLILAVTLLASCQTEGLRLVPRDELPADVYGRPGEPVPGTGEEIPEEGFVFLVNKGRLQPVPRKLPPAVSLPEALVVALLEGPVRESPLDTSIPLNSRLISVEVDQGIASVDLSAEFESGATGVPLALKLAQIVYTLTERETRIVGVLFEIEGEPIPVLTGNGLVVEHPVTRRDYARFAPLPPTRAGAQGTPSPGDESESA